ncbi:murein hydrolase activator EnvC family protein [Desulfurivibrio alkaliphilus]|uniref:Peptidase M23 n=1 Tax=Desulfurivibrio alkaliphilus (strain DSM 19089 / UNIQEM U267 / AHT2) TaxID=589865 RepID=D6Z2X0_DESAT|nr:peptidoglycan DD-metalloendopeptidase family protein [Desulfurivibrio alkaliphilus]ADH85895.1 Peptidase M23 [Desulfurivibrio alkaliphilus AHT 2]
MPASKHRIGLSNDCGMVAALRRFPLRTLLPLCLLLLLSCPLNGFAAADETADEEQQKLESLRRNLAEQEDRLAAARARAEELLAELADLDRQVEQQQTELATLSRHLEEHQQTRAQKQDQLAQLKAAHERAGKKVQRRLTAAYQTGEVAILNILFSAESLPDLLELQDYFHFLREHDQTLINGYRDQIATLQEARQHLAQLEEALLADKAMVKNREEQLQATRREQAEVLRRVQNQQRLHQQAQQEISKAVDLLAIALTATLTDQSKRVPGSEGATAPSPTPTPGTGEDDFANLRGLVRWPVEGKVITGFGQTIRGPLGEVGESRGIIIKTDIGAPVRALAAGTVAHVGEMPGYGKMIIVNHGQRYFSLLAGLAEINSREGAPARPGQIMGTTAAAGGAEGRLYLEIRQGVQTLDPMEWLQDNR